MGGATHHGVPAQRGPVGEGAAAQAAHVGLLPRVDALVPLQRVELRELLVAVFAAVGTVACRVGGGGIVSVLGREKAKGSMFVFGSPVWIFRCWWREFL